MTCALAVLLAAALALAPADPSPGAGIAAAPMAAAAPLAAAPAVVSATADPDAPGIFILGIDGMDPVILRRLMDEGRMPHFAKLAREGSFQDLGTSNPPQSPVAWSNFVTGMNPGGHGIYDFIHRDPNSYMPFASNAPPGDDDPLFISIFGFIIPVSGGDVVSNRSGTPFWDLLVDAGVEVEVFRMPGNYPPTPSEALTLTGMGTVDMRGSPGTYSWWTTEPLVDDSHLTGEITVVTVDDTDLDGVPDTVTDRLKGAPDIFHLVPGQLPGADDYISVPLTVHLDPDADVVWLRCGDTEAILKEGEWSEWLDVSFDALPWGMMPLLGSVRFYMKEVRPEFRLYASPVNIAAAAPAQPISTPDDGSAEIYDGIGHYYTQGFPEEINAFKEKLFDDADYRDQVDLVHEDSRRMLEFALNRFERGDTTFMYLSDIDLQCHLLWRHADPKYKDAPPHPAHEATDDARYETAIEEYYVGCDAALARVRERLPENTLLLVMSDHGFQPYTRKFHLNGWLRENGYLVLKEGAETGHIALGTVDWTKTRAYALGFNGVYLNRQGRERDGIVARDDILTVTEEIRRGLLAYRDPENDQAVIRRVWTSDEAYSGPRIQEAPDLIVGYDRGYGCSDASTEGNVTLEIIEDNTSRWSGNHLMDPEVVPGVLLSNRLIEQGSYDLTDLTVTLLAHYGLGAAPGMVGEAIPIR